jgi:hypothetical protein
MSGHFVKKGTDSIMKDNQNDTITRQIADIEIGKTTFGRKTKL